MRFSIALGCVAAMAFVASAAEAQAAGLISGSVNDKALVTLAGNTRPEAIAANDRGAVSDSLVLDGMQLVLKRSQAQETALNRLVDEQQDRNSPNYHKWLTAAQFGQRFGAAPGDINKIKSWLTSHGFRVNSVAVGGMSIDFTGNAGAVRAAFHTEIHKLSVNGVNHVANMSDPRIPAALAPAVAGIVSLNDFRPHTNYTKRTVNPKMTGTCGGYGSCLALTPADLATIYNLTPLFNAGVTGKGQTIVVIEDTDVYNTADWATFRSTFGLSSYTSGSFTQVHPGPGCSDPGVNGAEGEAILDAEWASAGAPNAAIVLASCRDSFTTFGGLIALQNMLNSASPPAIVSISYGECEAYNGATANRAYYNAYQQGVAEGTTVFVSSGDEGAASCDANASAARHGIGVSAFASTPFNVAVGGTDFADTYANCKGKSFPGCDSAYWNATNTAVFGSAKSYIPEIPWNDSCAGVLSATFATGSPITYGATGYCNTGGYLTTASGSGGPSGCATGTPIQLGVVGNSCQGWAKPSWQAGAFGNPADGVRDLPDVSLFASNGWWGHFYLFCDSNGGGCTAGQPQAWYGAGGTSFSSPILAGIMALVEQKTASRQGNANVVFYRLAASEYGSSGNAHCNSSLGASVSSSCIFYDVSAGDMDVNTIGQNNSYLPSGKNGVLSTSRTSYRPAYGTTGGWDFATGLGTVNANNLVNAWK
ncbi:MAG: S8/S53 family peptidase [Alphaproteobacteria bacterium]|nr:S8/S53 family peptidase [Alphaproteobacteria bacterium]